MGNLSLQFQFGQWSYQSPQKVSLLAICYALYPPRHKGVNRVCINVFCAESVQKVLWRSYVQGITCFFFYQDFLSFDIDKSHDRRRRAPLYHLDLLHKHLHTSRAITADYSPLHLARDWTGTKVFWFPSANH